MVCFRLGHLTIVIDFTAPALLALLSLLLPRAAFFHMIIACVLHESAHFFAMALTAQPPCLLRISAAGLRLELQDALCPLGKLMIILLAGAAANLMAAGFFLLQGQQSAAMANASLALFNLLPYRSTDGGTLLFAWLEHLLIQRSPDGAIMMMRVICAITTLALTALLAMEGITNPSLWGMLLFMTIAEAVE